MHWDKMLSWPRALSITDSVLPTRLMLPPLLSFFQGENKIGSFQKARADGLQWAHIKVTRLVCLGALRDMTSSNNTLFLFWNTNGLRASVLPKTSSRLQTSCSEIWTETRQLNLNVFIIVYESHTRNVSFNVLAALINLWNAFIRIRVTPSHGPDVPF